MRNEQGTHEQNGLAGRGKSRLALRMGIGLSVLLVLGAGTLLAFFFDRSEPARAPMRPDTNRVPPPPSARFPVEARPPTSGLPSGAAGTIADKDDLGDLGPD
jgi:hypothetical protein